MLVHLVISIVFVCHILEQKAFWCIVSSKQEGLHPNEQLLQQADPRLF